MRATRSKRKRREKRGEGRGEIRHRSRGKQDLVPYARAHKKGGQEDEEKKDEGQKSREENQAKNAKGRKEKAREPLSKRCRDLEQTGPVKTVGKEKEKKEGFHQSQKESKGKPKKKSSVPIKGCQSIPEKTTWSEKTWVGPGLRANQRPTNRPGKRGSPIQRERRGRKRSLNRKPNESRREGEGQTQEKR